MKQRVSAGRNIDLTEGPVARSMWTFALPLIAGNLLQQFYNVADTLIVGRFLGPGALAAVGSSFHALRGGRYRADEEQLCPVVSFHWAGNGSGGGAFSDISGSHDGNS